MSYNRLGKITLFSSVSSCLSSVPPGQEGQIFSPRCSREPDTPSTFVRPWEPFDRDFGIASLEQIRFRIHSQSLYRDTYIFDPEILASTTSSAVTYFLQASICQRHVRFAQSLVSHPYSQPIELADLDSAAIIMSRQ